MIYFFIYHRFSHNLTIASLNALKCSIVGILDRSPPAATAGLIGSSLVGAAAVMGGAMNGLLSGPANSTQDPTRRSSIPGEKAGGGFSSMFNLKSVINTVTKPVTTPQPTSSTSTSNFYVSAPPIPQEPINYDLHSQLNASPPQKSIQGRYFSLALRLLFVLFFSFLLFWWNIVLIKMSKWYAMKSSMVMKCCEAMENCVENLYAFNTIGDLSRTTANDVRSFSYSNLILASQTFESFCWLFINFLFFYFISFFLLFFVPFFDMLFSTRLPLLWHMNNCEKYQFETWWKTILQLEASQALIRVRHSKLSNHMLCKAFAAKLTLRMSLNWV